MKVFILQSILFLILVGLLPSRALIHHYKFVVKEAPYTRLCSTKNILTINGQFPGPTLHLRQADTILVDVYNHATENITIHWHGVKQPRHPWSDGPEYITQCPIRPGTNFTHEIALSDEIGTLWWHAHSDWSRATVHGLLIVYPKRTDSYPFPMPFQEIPLVLGEWWKSDIRAVLDEFMSSGGGPNASDAFLINGQPGDTYPCSIQDTYKLRVEYGKTYLFRMVNAVMNEILFFGIAKHKITVVGKDGAYTKPLKRDYIVIAPGNTIDFLLETNQEPNHYYIATKVYNGFDNKNTTAIIEYQGNYTSSSNPPLFPNLPESNDVNASTNFTFSLRSLASKTHPVNVPLKVKTKLFFTISVNTLPCPNNSCAGPGGSRFAASINNNSFVSPNISILEAYYYHINGIFGRFPGFPPLKFNWTADNLSEELLTPNRTTRVNVLKFNSTVEIVFQGTNLVAGIDHPMHLHGHSFYVVGWGLGNFDKEKDPLKYNLVDPPLENTIAVPINGWTAIRFRANNPGVWLMHCHLERHLSWGMETVFIVRNGKHPLQKIFPPPRNMPLC